MSDLIDRQAAIDAICKACSMEGDYHKCDGYPETSTWCDELVALRAVPAAQPERKTGRWIRHPEQKNIYGGKCVECSECGEKYVVQYIAYEKFCRNCGADMRGDDNDA